MWWEKCRSIYRRIVEQKEGYGLWKMTHLKPKKTPRRSGVLLTQSQILEVSQERRIHKLCNVHDTPARGAVRVFIHSHFRWDIAPRLNEKRREGSLWLLEHRRRRDLREAEWSTANISTPVQDAIATRSVLSNLQTSLATKNVTAVATQRALLVADVAAEGQHAAARVVGFRKASSTTELPDVADARGIEAPCMLDHITTRNIPVVPDVRARSIGVAKDTGICDTRNRLDRRAGVATTGQYVCESRRG